MPTLYDPAELGQTACSCGRLATRVHCPKCGIYTVYAFKKKNLRMDQQGDLQEYTVYRCRRCGTVFDDWQWQNECQAPIARPSKTAQQAAKISEQVPMIQQQVKQIVANPEIEALREKVMNHTASLEEKTRFFNAIFAPGQVVLTQNKEQEHQK